MSWKKIATVAVCALMTTSAWAGPKLDLRNVGLDSSGNWSWELRATPDASLFQTQTQGTGGSLAIELGLQASLGSILSVTPNPSVIPNVATAGGNAAAPVEFENPGNVIFGWETLTDVDPSPTVTNLKPVGIQIGTAADSNKAFIAVGTTFFKNTDAVPTNGHLIATIKTTGPLASQQVGPNNLITTSLQVLGSYGGNGAVAQSTGASTSVLFDDFAGTASQVIRTGDANRLAGPELNDLIILSGNFNKPGVFTWANADFNGSAGGTNEVDLNDLIILSSNFNQPGNPVNTPYTFTAAGSASGSSTTIPEPASVALAAVALVAGAFFLRRS